MTATQASSSLAKTPLDYIAQGYWQDFVSARAVAGGMAYQEQLQGCRLDGSLTSLQRIDTLLTQVRRDIAKSNSLNEATVLADDNYRNLLDFLAFYAGQVLAMQWRYRAQWCGQSELAKRYPELIIDNDDFYQHMAVVYRQPLQQALSKQSIPTLFFALEPIGLRLFGNIDRQFIAIQGVPVASGLYQAVSARLPDFMAESVPSNTPVEQFFDTTSLDSVKVAPPRSSMPVISKPSLTESVISNNAQDLQQTTTIDHQSNVSTIANISNDSFVKKTSHEQLTQLNPSPQPVQLETIKPELSKNEPVKIAIKPASTAKMTSLTDEIYAQSLTELQEIEVLQVNGEADYQRACKVLDQFERHIASQPKPRAQITFSQEHQAARLQALATLQQAAKAGHTAAMLRLALYELLGEGVSGDKGMETGINWVKQAATAQDSRAQRLLSRLYYQGIGVAQDMNNGKHWLEQAAKTGHKDAAIIVTQWQQAQALIDNQKVEQHSIKRYQLLIGIVIIAALLLIIFV